MLLHSSCASRNFSCQNPNLTSTQPVGVYAKMTLHLHNHPPPPPQPPTQPPTTTQTLCQQYLSCYQPDFDETLKVGSWERLEQIIIVTVTSVQSKCCPYQEYLSCYWPNFDKTLKVSSLEHLEQILTFKLTFVQAIFVLATFVHISNISAVANPILMKL